MDREELIGGAATGRAARRQTVGTDADATAMVVAASFDVVEDDAIDLCTSAVLGMERDAKQPAFETEEDLLLGDIDFEHRWGWKITCDEFCALASQVGVGQAAGIAGNTHLFGVCDWHA